MMEMPPPPTPAQVGESMLQSFKSGLKTTEFWKSAGCFVIGGALIVAGLKLGDNKLVEFGSMLTGGSTLVYTIARTIAKTKA
jgi:hypothetical protein